jgi:deoxyribodipyrimidine photo-lyase
MAESFGIHWFRRDLRVAGNPALKWNWKQNQGRTLGVFFFDSKFLARPDFSHHRFGFFLNTLKALQTELRELGGDLLVLDSGPEQGFDYLLSLLKTRPPTHVTFNRDYEPFARERDSKIYRKLDQLGISVHTERDHLLIEPQELKKDDSKPQGFYQVYTPFSKKWFSLLSQDEFQNRITTQKESLSYLNKRKNGNKIEPIFKLTWSDLIKKEERIDQLDSYIQKTSTQVTIPLPEAGSLAAYQALTLFKSKVDHYLEKRDYPNDPGTSHLSIYLKNGSITPAMVLYSLDLKNEKWGDKTGRNQFLKEIVWREFYYHILYHQPNVEHEAFLSQFRNLKWENREDWFEAWKQGKTGYPIVDAGMRQLNTTGWMHNRVRMIVASFLCKDLLISWQWGENYFMKQLLDGDLAPNNGGWQWAASTGCDPQPYFRIFNPTLQSEKFDPKGEYIKKFLPELKNISPDWLHAPWTRPEGNPYISPIVDHQQQKVKALDLYKQRNT